MAGKMAYRRVSVRHGLNGAMSLLRPMAIPRDKGTVEKIRKGYSSRNRSATSGQDPFQPLKVSSPMAITTDEIWQKLSTSRVCFFTSRTAGRVPHKPGVYAWFLQLKHYRVNKIVDFLSEVRKIAAYDTHSGGIGRWDSADHPNAKIGFNWDPLKITLTRDIEIKESETIEKAWKAISGAPDEVQLSFSSALMIGTFFARPLYVGLATDLYRRYFQHAKTGSQFKDRFESHVKEVGLNLTVDRLLFVCIPIEIHSDVLKGLTKERILALEHVLKVVCQPAFSDR
jgi:hypothetical protein